MEDRLSQLEHRIEDLLEGSVARWLGANGASAIAVQLARALDRELREDRQGRSVAPDQYLLTLHPQDVSGLAHEMADLGADLAAAVLDVARAQELTLVEVPHVTVAMDAKLGRGQARVVAWHGASSLAQTQGLTPRESAKAPSIAAFLLINGQRFDLQSQEILIGRHPDCDLVLQDPRVSRAHAQLRLRAGRYLLYDLGSKAGTLVNGQRVERCTLVPGDVIELADNRLVYGEEGASESQPTQALPPGGTRGKGRSTPASGSADRRRP